MIDSNSQILKDVEEIVVYSNYDEVKDIAREDLKTLRAESHVRRVKAEAKADRAQANSLADTMRALNQALAFGNAIDNLSDEDVTSRVRRAVRHQGLIRSISEEEAANNAQPTAQLAPKERKPLCPCCHQHHESKNALKRCWRKHNYKQQSNNKPEAKAEDKGN